MTQHNGSSIEFHYLSKPFNFRNRNRLKAFLKASLKKEGHLIDHINYIFCTDQYLLEINRSHLNHDNYTDVITFQLSPTDTPILADIYISIDRVADNAKQFDISFLNELHRVIFHGALHLCGYKDKSAKDARLMREMEDQWLKQYFVPRGTKAKTI